MSMLSMMRYTKGAWRFAQQHSKLSMIWTTPTDGEGPLHMHRSQSLSCGCLECNATDGKHRERRRTSNAVGEGRHHAGTVRASSLDENGLKNLEELDLTRARLRVLPAEIGTLTKLKRLYLGKNALKKLPEEIGNLKELEILDLTGNLLDEIPSQVMNLPRLKELGLEDNLKMLEVPKRMKKMETY